MRELGIGEASNINQYVEQKLQKLNSEDKSFETLFRYMFSERENVLYERSCGYRIESTTYGEAYDCILKTADLISRRFESFPKDSVIGLYMENCVEWIEVFWSIMASGFRPLLMNTRIDEPSLEKLLKSVSAKAVITSGKKFNSCPSYSYTEIMDAIKEETDRKAENLTFGTQVLFMSSGTSDNVKICAYTAEEFFWQISDSYYIILKCKLMKKHYNGKIKQLTILPFYHVFGFIAVYLWFTFFSRTLVHLENLSPQTVLNTIRRHDVTHIFAVPLFWETVYKQAIQTIKDKGEGTYQKFQKGIKISKSLNGMPLLGDFFSRYAFKEVRDNLFGESISFMISGGSEIKEEVLEFFNAIGYRLADGYGMTEIGITSVELGKDRRELGSCSVGVPFKSVRYKINDEGELLVNAKTAAKYTIIDGRIEEGAEWFNTHDLAEEKNGRYRILGRLDDVVIGSNGENLNPNIIEQLISREACLIRYDNKPLLLISIQGYLTKERFLAIQDDVNRQLKNHGLNTLIGTPVYISDPFVKDEEFKKNRHRISEDYKAGRLKVIENRNLFDFTERSNDSEIKKHVRALFATALQKNESEIGGSSDFFLEAGGNSLDYFALISQIQNDYGVKIPTDISSQLTTVDKLCEYIEEDLKNVD